jgi:hypothetical protein
MLNMCYSASVLETLSFRFGSVILFLAGRLESQTFIGSKPKSTILAERIYDLHKAMITN